MPHMQNHWLWFDVETRYKTTSPMKPVSESLLWFDVETRYKTTKRNTVTDVLGCGLMQKQYIKQHATRYIMINVVVV